MLKQELTILLLEDDIEHAELFLAFFEMTCYADARLVHVSLMKDALQLLNNQQFDLAFIDLSVTDSSFNQTLNLLPQLSKHCPAIVITSIDDKTTILDIISKGADDCIPKLELTENILERSIHFNLDRWKLKQQLRETEKQKHLESIVQNVPQGMVIIDKNQKVQAFNKVAYQVLGLSADCYRSGRSCNEIITEWAATTQQDGNILKHALRDISKNEYYEREFVQTIDGEQRWCSMTHTPLSDGRVVRTFTDISERKFAEEKLNLLASVFVNTREGIILVDINHRIIDVNQAFTQITGYSKAEVLGKNPSLLQSGRQDGLFYKKMWKKIAEDGFWKGEIWNRKKNGQIYPELLSINTINNNNGELQHYLGIFSDITQQKKQFEELKFYAHYDHLTNLPNRLLFSDRMDQAMALNHRNKTYLAIVYMDLDGFKVINDQHGHNIGDELLVSIAKRMQSFLRKEDTIARLGGDEFVGLISNLKDKEQVIPFIKRLLETVAKPVKYHSLSLQISTSIGISFYSDNTQLTAEDLIRQADHAMYKAKTAGKNCYHIYHSHD